MMDFGCCFLRSSHHVYNLFLAEGTIQFVEETYNLCQLISLTKTYGWSNEMSENLGGNHRGNESLSHLFVRKILEVQKKQNHSMFSLGLTLLRLMCKSISCKLSQKMTPKAHMSYLLKIWFRSGNMATICIYSM